jgi:tRNA 2-selenouridine synthase
MIGIEDIRDIDRATLSRFDAIIDVRSPAEFDADHLPGAVNLPVLSNEERTEVGTIYKQESRFKARRVGAAMVARNVARHLETALADKSNTFNPLIYCWRGGMRSNAMATILSQVGWRCGVLNGGYKTWRRAVVAELRDSDAPLRIVLLDGQTGTAKSDILRACATHSVQTLDLEACANHRGSVFGGFTDDPQPEQKLFESRLFDALRDLNPERPILIEAESNRIGHCEVPKRLWAAMLGAPRITLSAPPAARADYLLSAYADIIADAGAVASALDRLKPFHAKEILTEWLEMAASKNWRALAIALIDAHYDPLYERSRLRGRCGAPIKAFTIEDFDGATFERVAREIASVLSSAEQRKV